MRLRGGSVRAVDELGTEVLYVVTKLTMQIGARWANAAAIQGTSERERQAGTRFAGYFIAPHASLRARRIATAIFPAE